MKSLFLAGEGEVAFTVTALQGLVGEVAFPVSLFSWDIFARWALALTVDGLNRRRCFSFVAHGTVSLQEVKNVRSKRRQLRDSRNEWFDSRNEWSDDNFIRSTN
jgi:hypothetical protein